MNITAEIIRDFLIKRLDEESKKDNGSYTLLSNNNNYGLIYKDFIKDAISTYLYEDLRYAFEVDNNLLFPPKEVTLNDYDFTKDALNHIVDFYGAIPIKSITIIADSSGVRSIKTIDYNNLDIIANENLYFDIKNKVSKNIDWWAINNSYYIKYFEDTCSVSIIVNVDCIPAEYI